MSNDQSRDSHDHPIRVRYAETDQMQVAYHAHYLVWFEVGRAEFCRARGFTYEQLERETASYLVVAEATCRYHRPLRYDTLFVVRTWVHELRSRTLTFAYQLLDPDSGKLFAEGKTKHVVTGANGRPKSFPEAFRRFLTDKSKTRP